ncbi:uncharacterized protein LOC118437151 isoform X1 [Folsomia candida]|nr:uncharacterized protein LOC118437151 isoform X1 [Folsomia candida]
MGNAERCIAARPWDTYCGWPGDARPCCEGLPCLANKCSATHCVQNLQPCNNANECCWQQSFCRGGICQGCLQAAEQFPNKQNGCFQDSDCCGGGECIRRKYICTLPPDGCLGREEGCFFSPRSCCDGLTCAIREGGGLSAWYKCGIPEE